MLGLQDRKSLEWIEHPLVPENNIALLIDILANFSKFVLDLHHRDCCRNVFVYWVHRIGSVTITNMLTLHSVSLAPVKWAMVGEVRLQQIKFQCGSTTVTQRKQMVKESNGDMFT